MKAILVAVAVLASISVRAQIGGAEAIVKRQAHEAVNQTTQRNNQSTDQTTPVGIAVQPAPRPQPAVQLTSQQQSAYRLLADMAAIKTNSVTTPEQKSQMARDITGLLQGANKPSAESVSKLAGDLAAALTVKKLTTAQQGRLYQNINAILNNTSLSAAQKQAVYDDVEKSLQVSGGDNKSAAAVAADLESIAGELQKSAAK